MNSDDWFDDVTIWFYFGLITLYYLVYIIIFIGYVQTEFIRKIPYASTFFSKNTIDFLNTFIQVFIALFLIIRFHPFRKHQLRRSDPYIILASGCFLLLNLGIVKWFESYVNSIVVHKR